MNLSIQTMLGNAIQMFQDGNLQKAKSALESILKSAPDYVPALQVIGLIFASEGDNKQAIKYLSRAMKLAPDDAATHYNLAKTLSIAGYDSVAIEHHKSAVKLAPENPDAWLNYGKSLSHLERHDEALTKFEQSLFLAPNYAEPMFNCGLAYISLEKYFLAEEKIKQCLTLKPSLAEAWIALGRIKELTGKQHEALANYLKAFSISPNNYDLLLNIGLIYLLQNNFKSAIAFYVKASELDSEKFEAWINLGVSYLGLDDLDLALNSMLRALRLNPKAVEALANAGLIFLRLQKFNEAIEFNARALEIDPKNIGASANLGLTFLELERYEDAIYYFSKALELNQNYKWIEGLLIHSRLHVSSWDSLKEDILKIQAKVCDGCMVTPPYVALNLCDDLNFHLNVARIWAQDKFRSYYTGRRVYQSSKNKRKIKVAYFSSDFRSHPVGMLMQNIIKLHDRNSFEVVGFFLNENDNPNDEVTRNLRRDFDQNINLFALNGQSAISFLLDQGIDIAVDLNGHTSGGRVELFANRIAPIQVNYLGYPGTMGAGFYDYIIADQYVIPAAHKSFYIEKIAYLPECFFPADGSINLNSAETAYSRESQGLPDQGFIFCCFNNAFKITPEIFEVWMMLLNRVPNSVLWLSKASEISIKNITKEAGKYGVDPPRLIFAERMKARVDHLRRLSLANLFLDTPNYNAHTSAADALWSGVPVLTISGNSFASRVAGSQLTSLGLSELIAKDLKEYFDKAHGFASQPKNLFSIKNKLKEGASCSPLFNSTHYVKNLEQLYQKMLDNYQGGNSPIDLS